MFYILLPVQEAEGLCLFLLFLLGSHWGSSLSSVLSKQTRQHGAGEGPPAEDQLLPVSDQGPAQLQAKYSLCMRSTHHHSCVTNSKDGSQGPPCRPSGLHWTRQKLLLTVEAAARATISSESRTDAAQAGEETIMGWKQSRQQPVQQVGRMKQAWSPAAARRVTACRR